MKANTLIKKITFLLILFSIFLVGFKPRKLSRFVVINKSGNEIHIRLNSLNDDQLTYYLKVPVGYKSQPTVAHFTLERDEYQMFLFYIAEWDPVYAQFITCQPPEIEKDYYFNGMKNQRLTVTSCFSPPVNFGVPRMAKYWRTQYIY